MMYFILLNCLLSMLFIFLNHPLTLGFIIIIQTILIALITGFLYLNFWFSYILFLIMVGGMLIMFIYMTSIASNEKFKMSKKFLIFPLLLSFIMMIMFFMDKFFLNMIFLNSNNLNQSFFYNKPLSLIKFFNFPYSMMLIMLMIYLFITLIAVVKISSKSKGTLRQMK